MRRQLHAILGGKTVAMQVDGYLSISLLGSTNLYPLN